MPYAARRVIFTLSLSRLTHILLQMDRIAELSEENFLQRSVYEMERERVEYLVRAYLRNRLQKVPSRNPPL